MEMPGIVEELELVTMEAVAVAHDEVEDDDERSKGAEVQEVGSQGAGLQVVHGWYSIRERNGAGSVFSRGC
jgi:hypothetical protein